MRAAKKAKFDKKNLQELVPLNALSDTRFGKLAEKIIVEEVKEGHYLFRKGDRDNQSVYLLDGKINLVDGFLKVTGEIESGTDMARHPIANLQPRPLSARAVSKSVIARVDSNLLDVFLSCDHSQTADVIEIEGADTGDWVTRILQSEVFSKLPPSKIQSLLMKMKPVSFKSGETVVRQGDEGDYFYTIHEGRCAVTRARTPGAKEELLAELGDGDSFGEDALVSNTLRNATVTMLSDGTLMRLAKKDFLELLKKQLVKHIDCQTALAMVTEGAVWLDVRTAEEYAHGAFEDSVNIPLAGLRSEMSELVFNATYILYCDTGGRSGSAAFMLSHKGFDVYVLEGGVAGMSTSQLEKAGMPVRLTYATEAAPADGEAPQAEIIEIQDVSPPVLDEAVEAWAQPAAGDVALPGSETAAGDNAQAPQQARTLAELRAEKTALLAEVERYTNVERRLSEQLDLLREELGEAGEKLGEMYTRAKTDAEEKHLLREQYAVLQAEFEQQQNAQAHKLQEASERIGELQQRLDSVSQEMLAGDAAVAGELGDVRADNERLRQSLEVATERANVLEEQLAAQAEAGSRSASEEIDARFRDMEGRVESLTDEVTVARERYEQKCAELEAERAHAGELGRQNQGLIATLETTQQTLSQLQAESGDALREQQQSVEPLHAEIAAEKEASARLRQELEEIAAARDEKESVLTAALERQQILETEVAELRRALDIAVEQLQAVETGRGSTAESIQALERDKQALTASLQEAESRLAERTARVSELETEKQAAAAALHNQDQSQGAEFAVLTEQYEAAQAALQRLQAELDEASAQKNRLAEELQQQLSINSDLHAEYQARFSELSLAQEKSREEVATLSAQQQDLQQQLAGEREEKAVLQQQAESLGERHAADSAEKEQQIEEMRLQLDASLESLAVLESAVEERDAGLMALQQEISDREESRRLIEEQLASSREQQGRLRLEIEQHEQHVRDAEQEYQGGLRKAHDELTRKNDNEKELQGQIDRLRKQLEQATLDLHKQRESAQQDIDHIREQLHTERRARDEERADMAARQRELKEQLSSIASAHEASLGGSAGSLEQARSEIRAEEQARLREVLAAQAQSEDQLLKLQQELSAAHEEIAELVRQQKSLRQLDVDLLQEQNEQAVTTIAQLETQLKQLTKERDSALQDQTDLRERMSALRGEVEAARGLMSKHGQGQAEDVARLQLDLDEARKNAEIAVRLRAEAEAARDRAVKERDRLHAQLSEGNETHARLSVTSPHRGAVYSTAGLKPARSVGKPGDPGAGQAAGTGKAQKQGWNLGKQQRIWLGLGVGLGLTGVFVLVVWLLLVSENPLPGAGVQSSPSVAGGADVEGDTGGAVAVMPVSPGAEASPAKSPAAAKTGREQQPQHVASGSGKPAAAAAGNAATQPVAGSGFRDALQGGSRGPVMVTLPAASYAMGSPGTSLIYDESPRHTVTLGGFSISKYEVTFAEYDSFARATGRSLPHDENWGRGDRPVINVSWKDASAYADWLSAQTGKSYRLPTEAEWEYAVRAGNSASLWWDGQPEGVYANCFNCGSEWDARQTAPVGSFPANLFGLHDMAGNVQEWTQDCYKQGYEDAPLDGSAVLTTECTQRSVRGGGYTSPLDSLRSSRRVQYDQDSRLDNLGFRVVRDN